MRALSQLELLSPPGDRPALILALDQDGYLWLGSLPAEGAPRWEALPGPPDGEPHQDHRSPLERAEARIRADAEERDRLRHRIESLPPLEPPESR